MEEIWKNIEFTNNKFSVSNTGFIKNNINNKILNGVINRNYIRCCLSITGRGGTIGIYVHQIVAKWNG